MTYIYKMPIFPPTDRRENPHVRLIQGDYCAWCDVEMAPYALYLHRVLGAKIHHGHDGDKASERKPTVMFSVPNQETLLEVLRDLKRRPDDTKADWDVFGTIRVASLIRGEIRYGVAFNDMEAFEAFKDKMGLLHKLMK